MEPRRPATVQVADPRAPGPAAMLPGQNMAAEQALIAEARARARRRRQKIALAVIAAAAALYATGVLITLTVPGVPKIDLFAPFGPAGQTGTVTGHLSSCIGPPIPPGHPLPVDPGWVTVVRGTTRQKPLGHGDVQYLLPTGPTVARAYISNNYHQAFRFALPPGKYVLIGDYNPHRYTPGLADTYTQVSVIAGTTLHANLPDLCM